MRHLDHSRVTVFLTIATAVFFTAILYWPILKLPLLFDTLLHIRLANNLTLTSIWLPSEEFGFYRPFVFLPFVIIKQLFHSYPSSLLQSLNFGQQLLNTFLISALAWRLWHRWQRVLSVGLLFASYPFAYQALASYGNNIYPAIAGLLLLMLHSYLWAIQTSKSQWWLLTTLLFLIGLLSHETAVVFGILAGLMQWVYQGKLDIPHWYDFRWSAMKSWGQRWPFLLFIMLAGAYIVSYQFLPTGLGPQTDVGGNAFVPKILYIVQTAVYPISWFAHHLPHIPANTLIGLGLLFILALTAWSARQQPHRFSLLLGWGWWGVASLILVINLPTYYILHGARLVYLGGIGIILVWAISLDTAWLIPKIGPWLWGGSLGFIVITSSLFIRDRLAAFTDIASPLTTIDAVMSQQSSDEGVILINLPEWSSPSRNTYAVGVEYVTLMGTHLFAEELINENLQGDHPVLVADVPDLLTDPGYPYGVHRPQSNSTISSDWAAVPSHLFITTYTDNGIQTEYTGRFTPAQEEQPVAIVGDYRFIEARAVQCKNEVQTHLTWNLQVDGSPTVSSFTQLFTEDGRLLAQLDRPPLGLRQDLIHPIADWHMIDQRTFLLADEAQPAYALMGLYDFTTGERFPIHTAQGTAVADNAWRIPITPCDTG